MTQPKESTLASDSLSAPQQEATAALLRRDANMLEHTATLSVFRIRDPEMAHALRADANDLRQLAFTLPALLADRERLQRELRAWRWLHWGHPEASWACACGDVHGGGLTEPCEECGTPRPAKSVPTDFGFASLASSSPVPAEAPIEDSAREAFVAGFIANSTLADRVLFAAIMRLDANTQFNLWLAARSTPTEATNAE